MDPRLPRLAGRRGALLVVDVQRSFADPEFLTDLPGPARADVAAAVGGIVRAVAAARAAGTAVVWVRLRVPPTDPWEASNWFRGLAPGDDWPTAWEPCVEGTPGAEGYAVEPADGELVLTKRTYDGFAGTGLADRLRERGVEWLAVAGLTSDCCVLETAGSAFTHGFRTVVLADATAAHDRRAHDAALHVLSLHSAVVAGLDEVRTLW
ncbi:nicotinamidase-related amidase [Kineococcus radiotolerans]|uniref:Nicotinamidase-related amidase n=1 Tax=Kineococcus radiotolerans TaxID=131568 RepID=A0A7W4TPI9_KINRA|nr:isochorismatase family cysteine hydrolase [Kineococcus radiotolerans]MBB2902753.1 nicotinamidase-related amidase [Kineococcus radiotolerans]